MADGRSMLPEITEEVKRNYHSIRRAFSAGGVAYRYVPPPDNGPAAGAPEYRFALIATRRGTCWQLPKGTCEPGETSIETAIREVEEEVGLWTEKQAFLKTVEYWYWDTYRKEVPNLVQKRVDFYLLNVIGGKLSDASYEVDGVGWFTPNEALKVLTFKGERTVVELAVQALIKSNR